jgi:hypothetical protein
MARPREAIGGYGLQIWRVIAIILNKLSRTADNGWSCRFELGEGLITPHSKKEQEMLHRASNLGANVWIGFFWLRIGNSGRLLSVMNPRGSIKWWGISWIAE